jgi:hypothetical protein
LNSIVDHFSKRPRSEFHLASRTTHLPKDPTYLADMHRHLWFNRLQSGEARPLGPVLAEGDATLVAWELGTDVLWITKGPRGFVQKSVPAPGESFGWFQRGPYQAAYRRTKAENN